MRNLRLYFNESQPIYAYKHYAHKKNVYETFRISHL